MSFVYGRPTRDEEGETIFAFFFLGGKTRQAERNPNSKMACWKGGDDEGQ